MDSNKHSKSHNLGAYKNATEDKMEEMNASTTNASLEQSEGNRNSASCNTQKTTDTTRCKERKSCETQDNDQSMDIELCPQQRYINKRSQVDSDEDRDRKRQKKDEGEIMSVTTANNPSAEQSESNIPLCGDNENCGPEETPQNTRFHTNKTAEGINQGRNNTERTHPYLVSTNSNEHIQTKKRDLNQDSQERVPVSYIVTLYRNYKQLKQEMDIENVVKDLQTHMGLAPFQEKARTLMVDKLLSEIQRLLDETEDCTSIFEKFKRTLERFNRELADTLQRSLNLSTEEHDSEENRRLYTNFQSQRAALTTNVDPKEFIDDAVELGGLKFTEHYDISKAQSRRKRIEILFKALDSLPREQKWKILVPMERHSAAGNVDTPSSSWCRHTAAVVIGIQFEETAENVSRQDIAQETRAHEHPQALLAELMRTFNNLSVEEIRERLKNIHPNADGASVNSLNFHFTSCSEEDIERIKKSCSDGTMKSVLLSLLDKSVVETLKDLRLTVASIEVYVGNENKACLCYLNKHTFEEDIGSVTKRLKGYETHLIDRLIGSKLMTSELANTLISIKKCGERAEIVSRLTDFFRQDNVPQICFCMLEKVITEMKLPLEKQTHRDIDIDSKVEITSQIVVKNKELLTEEIDAKWFIAPLSRRKGKVYSQILKLIKTSKSRTERTRPFIDFLCGEEDLSWFEEEIKSRNKYLLDILSKQISRNQEVVSGLRRALTVSSEIIQDDLDPLELKMYLSSSLVRQLPFDILENETSRQTRASIFLQHIIDDEKDSTIPEVMDAMRNGYNDLVDAVKDIVKNGSLSEHYNCPRIRAPQCVFHASIDLTESLSCREYSAPDDENEKERKECTVKSNTRNRETTDWRVHIVKQYSLIKEEISRSSADAIAKYLLQLNKLTKDEIDSISKCSRRRKAVEKLLKMVLNGTYDMYNDFKASLHDFKVSLVSEKLDFETASEEEKRVFNMLEMSSKQKCPRPDSHEPRLKFERSEYQTLMDELNERNLIDKINDQLLSRQIFSIQEHSRVVGCSFKKSRRLQQLIKTLQLCSEMVLPTFIEILYLFEMTHVAEKLEMNRYRGDEKPRVRRKLLNAPIEEGVVTSIQKRQRFTKKQSHDPTILSSDETSRSPVSYDAQDSLQGTSLQRSDSNSSLQTLEKLGFDIDEVRPGSIVIMMRPKGPTSFQKLQNSCRTGQIKNFIPEIFADKELQHFIVAGEYRITLTIYVIKSLDKPDEKKFILHLENEEELQSRRVERDNPMKKHIDILSEELEITDNLLDVLKKGNIVDDKIKADLSAKKSRSKQTIYLVQKIMSRGKKGYDILKGYLKDTNEYLYKYMDTHGNVMDDNPRPSSTAEYSKEDIVFSCTVVMRIKKREAEKVHGVEEADLVITCPTILNPVLKFNGKEKKKCKQVKSSAKRSSTAKPEII